MLEVRRVSKYFIRDKKKFYADYDISFKVKEGEIFGILGPNGAGKTTLLRMISGIMEPSLGEILIDGMSYSSQGIAIKRKIAFLSGNTRLYKDITVYEFLCMCLAYYGIEKDVGKKRLDDVIQRFDMNSFLHVRIEKLSTGQYQRVNIARCLLHDPKYYILDEATSGLDIMSSQVILDFIKSEKKRGKCIIYSTHYMEEASNICDRVIMISGGRIISSGRVLDICKSVGKNNLRDAFFALIEGSD